MKHALQLVGLLFCQVLTTVWATCYDPWPAFPLPKLDPSAPRLQLALKAAERDVNVILADPQYDTSSISIELTSSKETLWSFHHTAAHLSKERPGTVVVDEHARYRIASITKVFTTLALLQQHAAGNLSLDDTIEQYISDLRGPQHGGLPWHSITLRTLASQLSGIPREFSQGDIVTGLPDPTVIGLPPPLYEGLPHCDAYSGFKHSCTRQELIDQVRQMEPLFAPNFKPTYSNIAFDLLGLVVENVTGLSYVDYVNAAILSTIDMQDTTFERPPDAVSVLPKNQAWYFDIDEGVQNPTGGLYSSAYDMSKFLRYVLTHYNGITPALNWLQPASYATGSKSYFGMPWEIFRTTDILDYTERPVTFVTKAGGLPGYVSIIVIMPEYDLGLTILVGGPGQLLPEIREAIIPALVRAIDGIAQRQVHHKYVGTYTFPDIDTLDSTIALEHTPSAGLHITRWISNGTNMLHVAGSHAEWFMGGRPRPLETGWRVQLTPTLLYRDEEKQAGEIFRFIIVPPRPAKPGVFDDWCITDVDNQKYDGKPLTEFVFWANADGVVEQVELTGFRVKLNKEKTGHSAHGGDSVEQVPNFPTGRLSSPNDPQRHLGSNAHGDLQS